MAKTKAGTPKPIANITAPALVDETQPTDSARDAATETATSSAVAREGAGGSLADEIAGTVAGSLRAVQVVLPNRLPTYLGVAALLVVGVVEPPVALAGGLVYEALRRWTPSRR